MARPSEQGQQRVSFEPTRPASSERRMVAFLLGAVVWAAALWLALVLLGHTYILRTLLLVTAVSWVVFALFLAWGIALRRRVESRPREADRAPH